MKYQVGIETPETAGTGIPARFAIVGRHFLEQKLGVGLTAQILDEGETATLPNGTKIYLHNTFGEPTKAEADKMVEKEVKKPITERIRFRENWQQGTVVCWVRIGTDWQPMFDRSEYRATAELAQARYNLSDADLETLYRDYKDDYDS